MSRKKIKQTEPKGLRYFLAQRPFRKTKYTLTNERAYRATDLAYIQLLPISLWRLRFTRRWSIAIMKIEGEAKVYDPRLPR